MLWRGEPDPRQEQQRKLDEEREKQRQLEHERQRERDRELGWELLQMYSLRQLVALASNGRELQNRAAFSIGLQLGGLSNQHRVN